MKLAITTICVIIIGFTSCDFSSQDPTNEPSGLSSILESEESGTIHGTEIGDEMDHVIKRIKPHIVSEMPDEITARIPLSMKDSTFFEIDYDFKNGKVYSLDLDIYPNSLADCKLLFNDFKAYYSSAYGKGQEKEDFIIWYTISKTGEDVEIIMMDESKSHGKPYLAITFYQEENISK